MDAYEVTRIVYSRVQSLEPENVSKIMGYLLLQDHGEHEMFRLALGPDALLQALVSKAKKELGLPTSAHLSSQQHLPSHARLPILYSSPLSHLSSRSAAPPTDYLNSLYLGAQTHQDRTHDYLRPSPLYSTEDHSYLSFNRQDQMPLPDKLSSFDKIPLHADLLRDELQISDQFPFLNDSPEPQNSLSVFPNEYSYPDVYAVLNGDKFNSDPFLARSNGRRPSSLSDLSLSPESGPASAWKPCLYYARGYCKHGNNCRFLHSQVRSDPVSPSSLNNGQRDNRSDDGLAPGSLERLEMELQELLRGRRAPVSIASLPQLYYEKYGKTLQAEGYLTESQRHGKAGYSLTKLLARLKSTVTLIDRPHGQHAVVLAEDAQRFTAYRGEKDDLSGVNPGSRQIYLTFPAESTFTEEDVSAHFRVYGPVQDVRIPYQQKRMFGFVTFVYPETVKAILAKGNPHYICGARVLVKPYREKGKHSDKKFPERGEHSRYVPSRSFDGRDYVFPPGLPYFEDHDLLRRQLKEQEQAIELERRRLADLQFAESQRQFVETDATREVAQGQRLHVSNGLPSSGDLVRATEDLHHLQTSSAFGYLLDVLDGDPGEELESQEKTHSDQQTDGHNLPDSPFTSPHAENMVKASSLSEKIKSLSLGGQAPMPGTPLPVSANSEDNNELTCRICMGFFDDPIQLDCNHMFCVQCILKVIRVSKDECPICLRHIGSQIVKLLESRGLQVFDPSLAKRGGAGQTSW